MSENIKFNVNVKQLNGSIQQSVISIDNANNFTFENTLIPGSGGQGDFSFDTSLNVTSTNAVQNKALYSAFENTNYQIAIIKENLFDTVLSEMDYKVTFATSYAIPNALTDTEGTYRVVFSETQLKEVEGNGVVLNQHLHNEMTSSNEEGHEYNNNSSVSINNGKMTITSTGVTQPYFGVGFGNLKSLQNHKVLCIAYISSVSITNTFENISFGWGITNVTDESKPTTANKFVYALGTWGSDKTATYLNVNGVTTTVEGDNIVVENYMIFDLTLMFGEGKEPTTVEEFNKIFPNDYYPFNEGEIKNTTIKGVKVNGYNLFDGNYRIGLIQYDQNQPNFGQDIDGSNVCSNEYIKVFGNQKYLLEPTSVQVNAIIFCYDKSKTPIKVGERGYIAVKGSEVTLPSNCSYIKFYMSNPYGSVYKNDICFHLSTLRTGYAPYKEPKTISFASTELLGAGEAHDTIEIVEGDKVAGIQYYNLVHIEKNGVVDLGTLDWLKTSVNRYVVVLNDAKSGVNNVKANIVCSKFVTDMADSIYLNEKQNTIGLSSSNQLVVFVNADYYTNTSAEDFKTAMNGVLLQYELAEPTRTTIAENLTFEQVTVLIQKGGSIEVSYENVPPNVTTTFVVKKAVEVE